MHIVCYGCGRSMGDNDVEATDEVPVWYGMHDEWGCGAGMMQCEWNHFNGCVQAQNLLPSRRSLRHLALEALQPSSR